MPNILTREQRSKNMRNIKSSDTKIELLLWKVLWAKGYRYRKNVKNLPGKLDIVIAKYKIAIFCDGEFFHGKDWDELREKLKLSNNGDFLIEKIPRNIKRDNDVDKELIFMGYTVIRFWGNDIMKHIRRMPTGNRWGSFWCQDGGVIDKCLNKSVCLLHHHW